MTVPKRFRKLRRKEETQCVQHNSHTVFSGCYNYEDQLHPEVTARVESKGQARSPRALHTDEVDYIYL